MKEYVRFHKDGTASVRSNGYYYLIERPKVKIKVRTRYARGHSFREVIRYLVGEGRITNLNRRMHDAMRRAGQAYVVNLRVVLEVITMQNVLDLVHKMLYTILPDQFVFRFKLGRLLDIGLGGWATV